MFAVILLAAVVVGQPVVQAPPPSVDDFVASGHKHTDGTGTRRTAKLSFEEARPTILASIKHPDAWVRVAAVRALNAFGAAAVDYVTVLQQLMNTDPDPQVRASAELAIEAIERDSRLKRH